MQSIIKPMLKDYILFLEKLDKELKEYFNDQKDFVFCKSGCSNCCKESYYPVSALEYEYIKLGLSRLDKDKQILVLNKAFNIFIKRFEFIKINGENALFNYECPFLKDKNCIIYEYRPILCRTYGLMTIDNRDQNKFNFPNCVNYGLNYANVMENNFVSQQKADKLGFSAKIKVFDIDYLTLKNRASHLDFGEINMLYEAIVLNTPDYQNIIKNTLSRINS